MQTILDAIPAYAKDIKLNLSTLLNNQDPLNSQQFWGILVACAAASKNDILLKTVIAKAEENISAEAITAAKSAAIIMAMNNIYYRFTHSVANNDYTKMPANLRMNVIAQPGIDKNDFELYSLAVSAINGCQFCMSAHEKILIAKGISKEVVQAAVRVAAITHATALSLE